MTPHVVYHTAGMGHYREVVAEQLDLLRESGLAEVRLTHVGEGLDWILGAARDRGIDAHLVRTDPNVSHYETFAMLEIERLAKAENTDRPILYLHTKGVTSPGCHNKAQWRRLMGEYVVRRWRDNLKHLDTHHAVGATFWTGGDQHFHGNFWLASPVWIRCLPDFAGYHWSPKWRGSRMSCEMWIGSHQWCIAKSLIGPNEHFWAGNYNFDRWMPDRNAVRGQFDYRGTPMQQHKDVLEVWPRLLAELRPARILEIGTGEGGFARFLRAAMDRLGMGVRPVWSVDPEARAGQAATRADGVVVRNLKPFGPLYRRADPLVEQFVRGDGVTLILCDGSHPAREFAAACRLAKPGDVVCGHDYAPDADAFAREVRGKRWDWLEFTDADAAPSVAEFAMERWKGPGLATVVWAGWRKGAEAPAADARPELPVTVVVPTIPPRGHLLLRALESVDAQTARPAAVVVETDWDHRGALATRNAGLARAETEWVAFLDDDDELYPHHLAALLAHAAATGADVVYAGCDVVDAAGSRMSDHDTHGNFGVAFDPVRLRRESYIPVTCLARREMAQKVGFAYGPDGKYEDWGFYLGMLDAGAKIVHLPERTWKWWHWGEGRPGSPGNTSGKGDRW